MCRGRQGGSLRRAMPGGAAASDGEVGPGRQIASVKDAGTREKALDGLAVALKDQTVNAPEGWAELQATIAKENDP